MIWDSWLNPFLSFPVAAGAEKQCKIAGQLERSPKLSQHRNSKKAQEQCIHCRRSSTCSISKSTRKNGKQNDEMMLNETALELTVHSIMDEIMVPTNFRLATSNAGAGQNYSTTARPPHSLSLPLSLSHCRTHRSQ